MGQAACRHGADHDPAGAAVGMHAAGRTGRLVGIAAIRLGSAGVLLGACLVLVSVRLAAAVHCAAWLDAVPQIRVCHRLAVQGALRPLSVPARALESRHTLAHAHLQAALGRHGLRTTAQPTRVRFSHSAAAAGAHVVGDNKYDDGSGAGRS